MRGPRSSRRRMLAAIALAAFLFLPDPRMVRAADFIDELERIDRALKTNPGRAPQMSLESCRSRRNAALELYEMGQTDRAVRRLRFCTSLLRIPAAPVAAAKRPADTAASRAKAREEAEKNAAAEFERALSLAPNHENGLRIYRECAACHMAEGWGLRNGSVPQIAGQHRKVVIKQLADIRAGNRDNPLMKPYSSVETIGDAQGVADVASYIDTLEISVDNGKGPGDHLADGKRLYDENCVRCHGATGEGDNERNIPRIQAQHYNYLVRQFEQIRDGKRRNAHPEMVAQIQGFTDEQTSALMDYVSRLQPPAALQAPSGWRNPDFARASSRAEP